MSSKSCNGSPKLKYQGFTQNYTSETIQTTITYQSNRQALEKNIVATTGVVVGNKWKCGNNYDYGRLDSINLQQADGPFWNATLTFSQPLSSGLIVNIGGDNDNATNNSLIVRMLSMPIQSHPSYRFYWNNILIRKSNVTTITAGGSTYDISTPAGVVNLYAAMNSATKENANTIALDVVNNSNGGVKWIKDTSQLPTEVQTVEDTSTNPPTKQDITWKIACSQTKPGVEYYDYPTYEITQYTKHKDRNNAAWALAQRSGKLRYPNYGDFGLENQFFPDAAASGYFHWLCLGGGVNFDGKYWVAQCQYQWSPDPEGWDQEIYGPTTSGEYNKPSGAGPNPILPKGGSNE